MQGVEVVFKGTYLLLNTGARSAMVIFFVINKLCCIAKVLEVLERVGILLNGSIRSILTV